MNLTRKHLGKIVRFDVLTLPVVPDGMFKQGDILVLFNNTDEFTTLRSYVKESYRSSQKGKKMMFEFPPRTLLNLVFVDDNILVVTVGM